MDDATAHTLTPSSTHRSVTVYTAQNAEETSDLVATALPFSGSRRNTAITVESPEHASAHTLSEAPARTQARAVANADLPPLGALMERRRALLKQAEQRELAASESRELAMVRWWLNVREGRDLKPVVDRVRERRHELSALRQEIEAFVRSVR